MAKSFFGFLIHRCEFDEKIVDGVQFCIHCKKANRVLPITCKAVGEHVFDKYEDVGIKTSVGNTQTVRNMTCKRCGAMKQFNLTTGQYTTY
jgi:hypothetical protein